MAQAARTYAPRRRYEEVPSPRIEVHRGQGRRLDSEQYRHAVSIFKLAIVVVLIACAICVARVWLVNASMVTLTEASKVTAQLDEARAMESSLELKYYTLTNASNIKPYAAEKLGMMATSAEYATYVDLTPDFLKTSTPQVVERALVAQAEVDAAAAAEAQSAVQGAGAVALPSAAGAGEAAAAVAAGDATAEAQVASEGAAAEAQALPEGDAATDLTATPGV